MAEFKVGDLVRVDHGRTIHPGRIGKIVEIDDYGMAQVRFRISGGGCKLVWFGIGELVTPPPLIALADCADEDSVFDE